MIYFCLSRGISGIIGILGMCRKCQKCQLCHRGLSITFLIEAVGNLPEKAGGKPAFEGSFRHSVALGNHQAGAGFKALGQFVVDGFLHPGESFTTLGVPSNSSEKDFGVNWFSDLSVSYKADRWEIALIGSNIVGTSQYERVRVSSTVQSYTLTHLRPREVLLKVCWDL